MIRNLWSAVIMTCVVASCGPGTSDSPSSLRSGGGRPGEFKGYNAFNDLIRTRFLDPQAQSTVWFNFSAYFGEQYPEEGGLTYLLGKFDGSAGGNEFRNGTPSGVSALLYYIGTSAMMRDLVTVCDSGTPDVRPSTPGSGNWFTVHPDLYAPVARLCAAQPGAQDITADLDAVWFATAGFDLPEAERQAFLAEFATGGLFRNASARELLAAALSAVLLNPYLLLNN